MGTGRLTEGIQTYWFKVGVQDQKECRWRHLAITV